LAVTNDERDHGHRRRVWSKGVHEHSGLSLEATIEGEDRGVEAKAPLAGYRDIGFEMAMADQRRFAYP
jgi:hypothetical protein